MVTHQNPSKMLTPVCTPMYSRFAKEQLPILTKVEDLSVHYEYPLCNIVPKKKFNRLYVFINYQKLKLSHHPPNRRFDRPPFSASQ